MSHLWSACVGWMRRFSLLSCPCLNRRYVGAGQLSFDIAMHVGQIRNTSDACPSRLDAIIECTQGLCNYLSEHCPQSPLQPVKRAGAAPRAGNAESLLMELNRCLLAHARVLEEFGRSPPSKVTHLQFKRAVGCC